MSQQALQSVHHLSSPGQRSLETLLNCYCREVALPEGQVSERYETFDLFSPFVEVEQLTKRRLFPDTALRVHRVANPLAAVRRRPFIGAGRHETA